MAEPVRGSGAPRPGAMQAVDAGRATERTEGLEQS